MPRKPKKQENGFMPLHEDSLKHAVEIPVKTPSIDDIEKIELVRKPRAKSAKSAVKKAAKPAEKAKKDYTLVITEKPQAALKIADALGNARKFSENGVPYYELEREGKKIMVACAVGHLFGLKQDAGQKGWPIYNISWSPSYENEKNSWSKKYYTLLAKLVKNAQDFIVATDYDAEGEVIGLNILRFIAKQNDAKRMKFSTLTKQEIEDAYKTASPTLNWGQAIAGETRHYLDWMYGINLSRALMEAIKKAGSFRIMSIGRVQGPALHFIVQREREIMAFKPTPYWQVFIIIDKAELKHNRDITKKAELIPLKELKSKKVDVKTEEFQQSIKPLAPFDLTTLQTEAYKFHGITPSKTLQIAQNLYLAGLISYPRTSSQKIPETISPLDIIKRLSALYNTKLCTRKKPIEGSKSDPAHPSIYPTGELADLPVDEKKVYDLIARRFLACFCEDAIVANKTITAMYKDYRFTAKGLGIVKKAWMDVYKIKLQEKELPDLNGIYTIEESRIEEKMTQPPNRYSPASIVRELERKSLGTKATRSSILETLYSRGYIKDQSIKATSIGMSLIESLEKHSPIIIDEKLTRKFEQETDAIQTAKKDLKAKQEKILQETKETINRIAERFKAEEAEIGKELIKANDTLRQEQRLENELVECPVCKKGKLRILYNKQSRRYFVACNAYPECKTTYSLPPNSLIKKSDKTCEHCGFPLLLAIRKGKRPWEFCFNPNCESNKREDN